jgi:hypothetical protein
MVRQFMTLAFADTGPRSRPTSRLTTQANGGSNGSDQFSRIAQTDATMN